MAGIIVSASVLFASSQSRPPRDTLRRRTARSCRKRHRRNPDAVISPDQQWRITFASESPRFFRCSSGAWGPGFCTITDRDIGPRSRPTISGTPGRPFRGGAQYVVLVIDSRRLIDERNKILAVAVRPRPGSWCLRQACCPPPCSCRLPANLRLPASISAGRFPVGPNGLPEDIKEIPLRHPRWGTTAAMGDRPTSDSRDERVEPELAGSTGRPAALVEPDRARCRR